MKWNTLGWRVCPMCVCVCMCSKVTQLKVYLSNIQTHWPPVPPQTTPSLALFWRKSQRFFFGAWTAAGRPVRYLFHLVARPYFYGFASRTLCCHSGSSSSKSNKCCKWQQRLLSAACHKQWRLAWVRLTVSFVCFMLRLALGDSSLAPTPAPAPASILSALQRCRCFFWLWPRSMPLATHL